MKMSTYLLSEILPLHEIVLAFGIEPDTLLVNEMKMNTGPKQAVDWNAAWLIYVAGGTLEEVSEATGIPYQQVIAKAKAKAWCANRAAAKRVASKDVANNLATRVERARIKHVNFVLDTLDEVETKLVEAKVGDIDPEDPEGKRKVTMEKKLTILSQHDTIARKTLAMDKEEEKRDPIKDGFALLVGMQKMMTRNRNSLVNEKQITNGEHDTPEAEIIEGEYQPVSPIVKTPLQSESAATAVSLLPDNMEAAATIESPFKGDNNTIHTPTETPQNLVNESISHQNGATIKKLPDRIVI